MAPWQAAGTDAAMHLRGVADGAAFMAQSALALAAAVATVLAVSLGSARRAASAAVAFLVAAAATAWAPQVAVAGALVPGIVLALGIAIAAGLRLRGAAAWLAVVAGGATAGIAGGLQTATWEEAIGGLLVLVVLVLVGFLAAARLVVPARAQRGAATARRMAGAWIAAVGVLLVALWLRRGG